MIVKRDQPEQTATFIFFVVDVNWALSPQTKACLDGFQGTVKLRGHPNFQKYLLRKLSAVLAHYCALAVRAFREPSVDSFAICWLRLSFSLCFCY